MGGRAGTAVQYDIRYSSVPRTGDAWLAATPVPQPPTPHIAGTGESFTVADLAGADTLFFAIRAADEVPNWSGWSNVTHTMLDGLAPAGITDLAGGAPADTAVTLTWTAVGDDGRTGRASRYDVRYSANLGAPWGEMAQVHNPPQPREAGQAESLRVGGLSSRTTYQFRIRVADEVPNWSTESNVVTMDPASPPSRITDLSTMGSTPTSVTLRWTAPGDDGATTAAAVYDIRYAVGSSVPWEQMTPVSAPPVPQAPGSTDAFIVDGLVADTGYSFAVQAGDDAANLSPVSNIISGRTADVTPPEAVVDLTIITTAATAVTVRWTNTGDNGMDGLASRVDLRYAESEITEASWTAAQQANALPSPGAPGSTTFFTVNGLQQERTYYFAVKIGDEVPNWSGLSNIVTTTTPDQTAPATVTDLVAGLPGATTIQLTWTAPGDDGGTGTANQYDIRSSTALITASNWASATPVPGIPVPLVGGSIQSFTAEGLLQGTVYYFALKAKDEQENESGLSNVVSSSTLDVIPPEAVTDLIAVSATGNSVSLRWTAPGDDGSTGLTAAYDVRYSTAVITEENWSSASQVTGEPLPQSHGTVENFSVPGLQGGTRYYFAVKAVDDAENWSGLSSLAMAETADQMAPAATTDLTISRVGPTSLRLSWTAAGDDGTTGYAARYDVRYATAPITPQNWASAAAVSGAPAPHTAGTTEYVDVTGLQQDVVYYFALKTTDEVPNWSELSNVPSAKTLDQVAPAAVTDLQVTSTTATTVTLRWTAPGDNGSTGTAAQYDVRYTTGSLNQATWNSATQAAGEPTPGIAGSDQTLTVTNLAQATTYRFGLKTADEVPNWSVLSTVVSVATSDISIVNATLWAVNGHGYEKVMVPTTWDQAMTLAAARSWRGASGHLVTLTSAAENQFVYETFAGEGYGAFLGGYKDPCAGSPTASWHWVTGESWMYTNWYFGEPSSPGTECVTCWASNGPMWNDVSETTPIAFIVEYEPAAGMVTWGRNDYGQCTVPPPNAEFTAVAGGNNHSLGLKADGSIVAWGWNDWGQVDVPSPNAGFTAISGANINSLGLRSDGSIVVWGDNRMGQCDVPLPNSGFVAGATGASHSLGLKADGSVVAWGDYDQGQNAEPSPNSGFVAIAAGYWHNLAVKGDGSIVAWGDNRSGQCNVPLPNAGFRAVAAGVQHSLALRADGSIVAWGANHGLYGYGQCDVPAPNSGFVAIAAGANHSLGLKSDGSVVVWGSNNNGQCTVPTPNGGFVMIAGGAEHSLGLK